MYQTGLIRSSVARGLTPWRIFPILSCVKTARTLALLALLAQVATPGSAQAQVVYNGGGLLHSPPSLIGGVVPSGPAIERTLPGIHITPVPVQSTPAFQSGFQNVTPPGFNPFTQVNTTGFLPIQPIQPIFPVNTINTINSSLILYPQGYGVFTDGLGNRTFIPRGSAILGNRGYGYNDAPRSAAVAPVAPPAPAPAAPEPVAAAPVRRQRPEIPANPSELEADANLESILRQEVEDRPDLRASIVLYDLVGRRKAEYHSPGEYYPSSIARLPVLVGVSRELARGALDPAHRIELAPPDDGSLSRRMGDFVSITELLQRMIRRGDLTATNALIDHIGFASINDAVSAVDLRDTLLGRRFNDPRVAPGQMANRMPTVDAATLLYKVLRRDLPERGMAARMLDLLSRQTTTAGIPRLLRDRPGTQVWGLTASARLRNGHEVANDVAIVTASGHAYVLAVYTDAPTDHSAWIGELALRMHDAMSQHRADVGD